MGKGQNMRERIWLCGVFISIGLILGLLSDQIGVAQPNKIEISAVENNKVQSGDPLPEELKLYAQSAVLMDADSGRVLYSKGSATFRPMASTTKIMTCILALENGHFEDVCTVSEKAAAQPKVHLGASKGTEFYLKDLLYSLMLESHNDSAVMVAEHIGGSVENFAAMMNQKARDIGCSNTCFVTPNGLDATVTTADGLEYTHGTTAEDLARVMRYCIMESPKREEFLEITRMANYSFTDVSGKKNYSCVNHNTLLSMMEGALSGKTGFTNGAGYSYVGALESEGRTYVIALLGSGWPPHKSYKWTDARTLYHYGMEQFCYRDVYEEPTLPQLPVENGVPEQVDWNGNPLRLESARAGLTIQLPEAEQHLNLLLKDNEQVTCRLELPKRLTAPVTAGQPVGYVKWMLGEETVKTCPVYAADTVKSRDYFFCLRQIWSLFILPE